MAVLLDYINRQIRFRHHETVRLRRHQFKTSNESTAGRIPDCSVSSCSSWLTAGTRCGLCFLKLVSLLLYMQLHVERLKEAALVCAVGEHSFIAEYVRVSPQKHDEDDRSGSRYDLFVSCFCPQPLTPHKHFVSINSIPSPPYLIVPPPPHSVPYSSKKIPPQNVLLYCFRWTNSCWTNFNDHSFLSDIAVIVKHQLWNQCGCNLTRDISIQGNNNIQMAF